MKRRNEVMVGLLTIVAVAILISGTYWLSRGSFRGGYPLYTVVGWGQGLKTGARVLFAGVSIGFVEGVELRQREGTLAIKMIIEKEYEIPRGSTASVQPAGIFGDMQIAITPAAATDQFYERGDTMPAGRAGATPSDIIMNADSVTRTLQLILTGIHTELIQAGTIVELRNTLASANRLVAQLGTIAEVQSRELTNTMTGLRRALAAVDSASIDSTLRGFQRTSGNMEQLSANLQRASEQMSAVLARLESGEGTAAKLLNDPALYNDLRGTVNQMSELVADIKANPRRYLDLRFSIFGGRR